MSNRVRTVRAGSSRRNARAAQPVVERIWQLETWGWRVECLTLEEAAGLKGYVESRSKGEIKIDQDLETGKYILHQEIRIPKEVTRKNGGNRRRQ